MKITDVNDVVSLDDEVYIKVMDVTLEETEDGSNRQRRHRLKLSMKYVHQDTGQDLDPNGELMEQDLFRSSQRSNGGSGGGGQFRNEDVDGTGGANSMLGQSLSSNIGLSSAIDPGSLILKGKMMLDNYGRTVPKTNYFNGYSLVGEDEGELEVPGASSPPLRDEPPSVAAASRPMGRGRATTLPAWMTRQDDTNTNNNDDNRLGSMKDEKGPDDKKNGSKKYVDQDSSRNDRHRKKSSRRDDKHHHHRHRKHKDRKHRSSIVTKVVVANTRRKGVVVEVVEAEVEVEEEKEEEEDIVAPVHIHTVFHQIIHQRHHLTILVLDLDQDRLPTKRRRRKVQSVIDTIIGEIEMTITVKVVAGVERSMIE